MKFKITDQKKDEALGLLLLAIAMLILVSLISHDEGDLARAAYPANTHIRNWGGIVGANISELLLRFVGLSSYIIPALLLIWSISRFQKNPPQKFYIKLTGIVTFLFASASLLYMVTFGDSVAKFHSGGFAGFLFSQFLVKYFGNTGAYIVIFSLLTLSMLLATEFLLWPVLSRFFNLLKNLLGSLRASRAPRKTVYNVGARKDLLRTSTGYESAKPSADKRPASSGEQSKSASRPPAREEPAVKIASAARQPAAKVKRKTVVGDYHLPSLDLLDSPPPISERTLTDDLKTNSKILEDTLLDFDIEAKVVEVNRGPVITRYELEPAAGVKVNRITTLSDDLALAMKAQSVRIVAPIPGKGTVGVEVPNTTSTLVYIKEVFESKEFQSSKSKLMLAIGKDISGTPVVADLTGMPHLMIAGATGSGKTVCVNSLIMSMLFNASPEEVKLLLIDPKRVEMACFNGLPHLLCPVVTEVKKVSLALDWVVSEMDKRYELLAKAGVRNIEAHNEKLKEKDLSDKDDECPKAMPYIVVIIDELADLMMVAAEDVEGAITRLAQLSRAVGIHIILATQRPSVDVITGVIKANFPSRVSFKVASKVDSRTVLDMNGADKLLGKGDLLFIEPGEGKPTRAQGCLVTDTEIERVVSYIKSQREPDFDEEILVAQEKKGIFRKFEKDEIYQEAVRLVLETKQASVSMLQRRLGVGYTRAARLVDMMEEQGIVGPYQGSKARDILVESMEDIKMDQPEQQNA